ncbi:hypothetical protein DNJ72_09055 [Prochlorococcus marinus XMU1403]|uniref:glycosyltransferase n=1 Tax=Prochlorococcus marinus TaxID=1219 RepID=UPI000D93B2F2|nr:glycosyltransferase [Prochlorococcus marinus]MBW3050287.1 hypothetical protein [Prochlorococcus marinus str. MU1403]PYE00473.1 hypothetical protein DNJ72_09055 [Prochlorococcus marinus XMU1403]
MRIAIDISGVQSLGSRKRGIGRYSYEIITNILDQFPENEYVLIGNACLVDISSDFRKYLNFSNVNYINWYSLAPLDYISKNENALNIARYLRSYTFNRVFPDVILITSFFEGFTDNCFTDFDKDTLEAPVLSIFYDLIPLLHPNLYLNSNHAFTEFYLNKIDRLKELDGLLSISSSSKNEAVKFLGFDEEKVYNISSACNTDIFNSNRVDIDQTSLVDLDILNKYILYSGAGDPRKNIKGFLKAYSKLSSDIQLNYKLVFSGKLLDLEIDLIHTWIKEFNINDNNVVLLGYVSDKDLVALYQNCALFVFPSFHEGFGLPILEAMSCGAPAIGSNCTSIPEIIGDAKAMFDPYDTDSIKDLIHKALTDNIFRSFLLNNASKQIQKFSWLITSKRVLEVCEKIIHGKPKDYSNCTWEYINSTNNNYLNLVLEKIKNDKNIKTSLCSKFANQIASSIDLINLDTDFISRSLIPKDSSFSWRVEGPFDSNYSLAILNRSFAQSLSKTIQNVTIHNTEGPGDYVPDMNFLKQYPYIYNLYNQSLESPASSTVTSRNLYPPRVEDLQSRVNLLHSYGWEESEFPQEWAFEFNTYLQGISVMSSLVKKVLIDNGVRIPISVCGLGIDHLKTLDSAKNFSINSKKFRFLHVSSCFPRKGIDILLRAYGEAFCSYDDVTLIIKTFNNSHNNIDQILNKEQSKNSKYPDVIIINDDLSDSQLKALYLSCDALVAPSRGEGFGLPIAEAMLLDLPVITTAWGGQTDFCNHNNSWLIDYEFLAARTHFDLGMSYWAEPSCAHLSELMKELFHSNKADISSKIITARSDIEMFTWQNTALKNLEFSKYVLNNMQSINPRIGWITSWETRCGIASYSKNLIDNISSRVTIFTPFASQKISSTYESIQCWELDNDISQDLSELFNCVMNAQITSLVIQFNYGFFNFSEFSSFIDKLSSHKINIILFMHSTLDPSENKKKRLDNLIPSLSKCRRILVHTLKDLNRLKLLGLNENVSLFPHGIKYIHSNLVSKNEFPRANFLSKKNKLKIASYGFCLPNKGFNELIKAVKILSEKNIYLELNLFTAIYNDSYKYVYDELIDLVNKLNIRDLVNINTEYMTDERTVKNLSLQDVIVFPYQHTNESSSASVRQALAALRPTLATPNPIFNDISDCIEFLPGFSSDEIANGIINWLKRSKNKKQSEIFHHNKQKFISNFQFSKLGFRLNNMIHSLEIN